MMRAGPPASCWPGAAWVAVRALLRVGIVLGEEHALGIEVSCATRWMAAASSGRQRAGGGALAKERRQRSHLVTVDCS